MRRLLWLAVGLALLAAVGGAYFLRERLLGGEARIGGRTEAQWLEALRSSEARGSEAVDALVALGDAGLPVLLAARKDGDLRAHRRAVGGLVRLGAVSAAALVEALPVG